MIRINFTFQLMKQITPCISILFFFVIISFSSCKEEEKSNEDLTNTVNKNGSVETSVTVHHLDSLNDILVTKHKVWHAGNISKDISYSDTIPALGMENKSVKNSAGESQQATVKKDYEIFITVK